MCLGLCNSPAKTTFIAIDSNANSIWLGWTSIGLYCGWHAGSINTGPVLTTGWHHFAVTCNGTTVHGYLDGTDIYPAGVAIGSTTPGACLQPSYPSYEADLIDDFCVLDHALTADEVKQLYTSNAPITVATSPFQLMLTGQGKGRVCGDANGLFGFDSSGNEAFALATGAVSWGTLYSGGLAAGDLVLGDPDNGSHLYYDASDGKLKFRGAGSATDQVYIGTDGKIYAGVGYVKIGTEGIELSGVGLIDSGCMLRWKDTGSTVLSIGHYETAEKNHINLIQTTDTTLTISTAGGGTVNLSEHAYVYGNMTIGADLNHDGTYVGFYGTVPIVKPTGVAVTAAGIHAALVSLGLIAA